MGIKHLKGEGELIPMGWAVAYRDFDLESSVCYPIPLHFVVRWLRDARCWLMRVGRPGFRERIEQRERLRANTWSWTTIERERISIHDKGFAAGWQAAYDKIEADLGEKRSNAD